MFSWCAAALPATVMSNTMGRSGGFCAALVAGIMLSAASAKAGVLITIDKSMQRMSVSVDGVRHYTWPVSTGHSGYATPSGAYTPFRMEEDHYSKEWDDAPMPHSIFFTPKGHAIHGSYETKSLGAAVSHGCVRISPKNADTLFALVKEEGLNNTKVVLTGQAPSLIARRPAEPRQAVREAGQSQQSASPYGAQDDTYGRQAQEQYEPRYQQPYAAPREQAYGQSYYSREQTYGQSYYSREPASGQPFYRQPVFGDQYPYSRY